VTGRSMMVLGAGALAVWCAPLLAWIDPLRFGVTPSLAGLGRADHLALTFDDGPDPASTPFVLAALDRLGWKATFFLLGSMTAAAPGLASELVAAGHEVGAHGYYHQRSLLRSPGWLRDDLRRGIDIITSATGARPQWYRPPFGELSAGALVAARRSQVRPVLWSAWGRDWRAEATPSSVVADLQGGILGGGTALLHDSDCTSAPGSWKVTVAALPLLASVVAEQGLHVGPLRDHSA